MIVMLLAAMLAPSSPADDCIHAGVPPATRESLAASWLAKAKAADADALALGEAVDRCAKPTRWTIDQALHASGAATMRFTAELLAKRLGHPSWAGSAASVVAGLSAEQIDRVGTPDAGEAELKLVLQRIIAANAGIAPALNSASDAVFAQFILMLRVTAAAESERRKL